VTRRETTIYLTGGATAVIEGWRASTVDVDLRLEPDSDEVLKRAHQLFAEIEPDLFRYPAIDAAAFRAKVVRALGPAG
jgi:hypothetical protein